MNKLTVLVVLLCQVIFVQANNVSCDGQADCKTCINGTRFGHCGWCEESKKCLPYDITDLNLDGCKTDGFMSNCIVNHKIVLIAVGVGVGLLLLLISGCAIWCCCCRGKKARKLQRRKEEEEYEKKREEIKLKHEASRAERQVRIDALREKYGLSRSNPYQKFENE